MLAAQASPLDRSFMMREYHPPWPAEYDSHKEDEGVEVSYGSQEEEKTGDQALRHKDGDHPSDGEGCTLVPPTLVHMCRMSL